MNELLKNYIEKSGYKIKYLAKLLHITYQGLYNKLIGKSEFTAAESLFLKDKLEITDSDYKEIFSDESFSTSD